MFKDTKDRLSKRTGLKGKQLERIKFALISRSSYARPEYLKDGELADINVDIQVFLMNAAEDVLFEMIASEEDCLGLDHPAKARPGSLKGDSIHIR